MPATLLIRADASPEMGTGHVMRCLAMAEQWLHAGGDVWLATGKMLPALARRAAAMGVRIRPIAAHAGLAMDAAETLLAARECNAAWLMVDGYQFDADYQHRLRQDGPRLLWMDDFGHCREYCADLVVNQNLGILPESYPRFASPTRLLLGCRYALLRREFVKWQPWRRSFTGAERRLLVTLGGSDPENVTLKVAHALRLMDKASPQATVVVGESYCHRASLESVLAGTPHRILQNATNMPELMTRADVAFGAGGTTTWEFAFMGLPSIMIITADNQVSNCEQMARHGTALNLGWHRQITPDDIARGMTGLLAWDLPAVSARARQLVDGYGSLRIWRHMHENSISLRSVSETDCRLIWEWANDPTVRAVSFSSEPIGWEPHRQWFGKLLFDANCLFWIAENSAGQPFGQVRFDLEAERAIISVSLVPSARGQDQGCLLIWLAVRQLFRQRLHLDRVVAFIKLDNQSSVRSFQKAGFELQDARVVIKGHSAWCCEIARALAEL